MRKSKAIKLLSLILATIFAFNSFATVVSDNDGSAFITKAELVAFMHSFVALVHKCTETAASPN